MSRLVRDLQLVDARGRKYLAADERRCFLEAAAQAPQPVDQTFVHTGARVSEALAICPRDVDLKATSIRIRTLKRRAERATSTWTLKRQADHWSEILIPSDLLCALKLVHALRSTSRRPPAGSSGLIAGADRKIGGRCAFVDYCGHSGPRQPADYSGLHHCRRPRGAGSSVQDVGKGGEFRRIQRLKASGEGA